MNVVSPFVDAEEMLAAQAIVQAQPSDADKQVTTALPPEVEARAAAEMQEPKPQPKTISSRATATEHVEALSQAGPVARLEQSSPIVATQRIGSDVPTARQVVSEPADSKKLDRVRELKNEDVARAAQNKLPGDPSPFSARRFSPHGCQCATSRNNHGGFSPPSCLSKTGGGGTQRDGSPRTASER